MSGSLVKQAIAAETWLATGEGNGASI
jgi:hypothetical protein